jgi:hypothetical protein
MTTKQGKIPAYYLLRGFFQEQSGRMMQWRSHVHPWLGFKVFFFFLPIFFLLKKK